MTSLSIRVATRYLTAAYFQPGEYIFFGKFKNKIGKIIRIFLDSRDIPQIEIEPVPKGRKSNRIFSLYTVRKLTPEALAKIKVGV